MKYDRDIRRIQIAYRIIIVIDLFLLGGSLYKHLWTDAIAAGIWAINCGVMLRQLKVVQRTRDRVVSTAIFRELEDLER